MTIVQPKIFVRERVPKTNGTDLMIILSVFHMTVGKNV